MNARTIVMALGTLLTLGMLACVGVAQEGAAEKVGQKLDDVGRGLKREVRDVGAGVRKRFEIMRGEVGGMGVHSRVYSRLHWDRALYGSKIEVHMLREGGVLVRGTVPDQAAREHALALVRETVGVTDVVDELLPLSTASPAAAAVTPRAR